MKKFIVKYKEDNLFIEANKKPYIETRKKKLNDIIYSQLEEIGFENTIPVMVEIELTDKCNMYCIHCSVIPNKQPDLKTSEFYQIIDQLESIGCFELTFTGGEIFTRKDVLDIIGYADQKNFAINLLTSATFLNIEQIKILSKVRLNNIQISVYSAIPEIHDRITRVHGSFKKTLRNIELLLSNDVPVTLACVVMNINYPTYQSVKKLAEDLGCNYTIGYPIRARDDGSKDTFDLRLSNEEVYQLFRENEIRFCKKYKRNLEEPICHAGRVICSISSKGYVFPCILFPLKAGNLINSDFKQIWNNSSQLSKFRRLKLKDTYECRECGLLEYCPICPGLSLLEEKNMLAPAKINCIMADAKYKIMKKEVMNDEENGKKKEV